MSKSVSLEDLLNMDFGEENEEITTDYIADKSRYKHYSKTIAVTFGYLLGVPMEDLEKIPNEPEDFTDLLEKIERNQTAVIIRHLNSLRSLIILQFKNISRQTRITSTDFVPVYKVDILKDDFKALEKENVKIITGRSDLVEYITIINNEIKKRIDNIKVLFPDWVNFKYIANSFIMSSDINTESKKYLANQICYPYRRFFNWKDPYENGNILLSDVKLLSIIYESNGDFFSESGKVVDASDVVKDSINEFLSYGQKIQVFVDGENADPFRFAAAMESLTEEETEKIDRIIVYYDDKFSTKAWIMLKHFTRGIEVEAIPVSRLVDNKSLVDHKLVAGVSKAVYQDGVDSVILCSSDSDFWSVIEDVKAKYLVMAETDKCGFDFKEVLREHNIFYCYLDRFKTPSDNPFRKMVFKKALQDKLNEKMKSADIDFNSLFSNALNESRVELSDTEQDNVMNEYLNNLKVAIDKEGKLTIVL